MPKFLNSKKKNIKECQKCPFLKLHSPLAQREKKRRRRGFLFGVPLKISTKTESSPQISHLQYVRAVLMHPLSNYTLHLEKCCQTGASCSSNADVAASKLKNPWRITHTFHLYTVGLLLRRSTAWQLLHKVLKMYTLQHGWKTKPETIPWPVAQLLSFLHWGHMWDVFNSWCVWK